MAGEYDNLAAAASFASAAEKYCRVISSDSPACIYSRLETALCELHRTILPLRAQMPDEEPDEDDSTPPMTRDQWLEIARGIHKTIQADITALIAEHRSLGRGKLDSSELTRMEMFADDLADIYHDLQGGLALWKTGEEQSQIAATWEWRYGYEIHWGHHLARAMITLYEIRYMLHRD